MPPRGELKALAYKRSPAAAARRTRNWDSTARCWLLWPIRCRKKAYTFMEVSISSRDLGPCVCRIGQVQGLTITLGPSGLVQFLKICTWLPILYFMYISTTALVLYLVACSTGWAEAGLPAFGI